MSNAVWNYGRRLPNAHQLAAYLALTGWVEDGSLGGLATVWHRLDEESAGDAEVVVPTLENVADALNLIDDALIALAQFQSRSVVEVVESIFDTGADIVRVRVVHSDVEGGSIPVDDGVLLNQNARDLLLSAANSSVARKKMFLGGRPDIANTYMKSVRLGQTSIGSYVVNLIVPIQPTTNELENRPFSRVVTENLNGALTALQAAAAEFKASADLAVFDRTIDKGVSANMCEALIGMSGVHQSRKLSVSVVASPLIASSIVPSTSIEFDSETFPAIQAAVEYFKDNYVLTNRTIRGYVKRLDRIHGEIAGTVAITTVLFGKNEKNVSVELSAEDYAEAIKAHEQNLLVEIHGDIHVTPRTATMLNPTGFRVFNSGDLF